VGHPVNGARVAACPHPRLNDSVLTLKTVIRGEIRNIKISDIKTSTATLNDSVLSVSHGRDPVSRYQISTPQRGLHGSRHDLIFAQGRYQISA
jgi:hypothetical protein